MYRLDTSELEDKLRHRTRLEKLFKPIRQKAGERTWDIVMSMLQAAWLGDEHLVPTKEHPLLKPDGDLGYNALPVEGVPDEIEPTLKMLLEDPAVLRQLDDALDAHFTLLMCPYMGGVTIRALLGTPGGKRDND